MYTVVDTHERNDFRSGVSPHKRAVRLMWAMVRLPSLVILAYVLRNPILNLIERQFDILPATRFVIDLLSTPVLRLACGVAFFLILLGIGTSVRRLRPTTAYAAMLVSAGTLMSLASVAISARRGLVVEMILAVNLAPGVFARPFKRLRWAWSALMIAGIGVAELFLAREYWLWLRGGSTGSADPAGGTGPATRTLVPGLILASLAFAVLIHGQPLLPLEQLIRMPREVRVVERGSSMNWIELDPTGKYLYVTGHELSYLRRYDLRDLSAPPLLSHVSTGGAQGFAYDPGANEIYAFNVFTNQLLYFDATTLDLRRAVAVPDLSPGDPWVAIDAATNTLTIVSEADQRVGVPFIVLDRATGRVLARADLDAGNVLKHPTKTSLYLTFFRRRSEVVQYDLRTQSVAHSAPTDSRAERMVFWRGQNELLVTSPMESRVLRFDADRLYPKGEFAALFGVRAMAIDELRHLLVCGNIATGHLAIIDLRTGTRLRSVYLGPWLRTIQLHIDSGIAYVSSNGALYRVPYASPLSPSRPSVRAQMTSTSSDAESTVRLKQQPTGE